MDSKNMSTLNIGDGHGESLQHQAQSSQSSITAFLAKLWALVNDSSCDDLIAWDPTGGSFHVYDQSRFAREILPRYFKHNNFASFIRQLNMYGFRKMSTIEHGSLKNERDDIEFAHPHFIRGQDSLLELIKRRAPDNQQKSNTSGGLNISSALVSAADYLDSKSGGPVELIHLLEDVRNLHSKQTSLNDKLSYMQTENEALWGEIGSLRQKHNKQQQIVSKLMEFLLHIVTTNSTPHEQAVEQQMPNVVITNDGHNQQQKNQHHTNNSPINFREQNASPNALKRKQVALMHSDEPNKRPTTQQQQQQQQQPFPHSMNLGRQQSVTINELADNDTGGWLHTTNTSPLVDLVPSPPPSAQNTDDNYQQQQNDYIWPPSTNELLTPSGNDIRNFTQQNKSFRTVGNGDNVANTYIPDFFLQTDNPSGINTNIGQIDGTNSTGIMTSRSSPTKQIPLASLLKEEQLDFPNTYQAAQHHPMDNHKISPVLNASLYSQEPHKIDQLNQPVNFSLDDITGDVDHIQSTLENIRELIFDNLPDGTSIEDLFCEENGLLCPLLHSTSTNNQPLNLILENLQEQKTLIDDNNRYTLADDEQSKQILTEPTISSQSVPDVNNQILEQLITESARVEEQRHTITQLEREKSDLEDKIHILEKQTSKRN